MNYGSFLRKENKVCEAGALEGTKRRMRMVECNRSKKAPSLSHHKAAAFFGDAPHREVGLFSSAQEPGLATDGLKCQCLANDLSSL